jgi:hypothetical protein
VKDRTIVCVLRTGGWCYTTSAGRRRLVEYGADHVRRLHQQVRHFAPDTPFLCLSDTRVKGVRTRPLQHAWPGWWAKMELFRLDFPLLYLDLDTALTESLSPLLAGGHDFTLCGPFSSNAGPVNSSVMAWDTPPSDLYAQFAKSPEKHMQKHRGDQDFIAAHARRWQLWDDLFPGAIASYKNLNGDPTDDTRIVVFNGKPKPEEVSHPWLQENHQ